LRISQHPDIAILATSGDTASMAQAQLETFKLGLAPPQDPDEKAQ
jgi:hypothetical protein